MTVDLIINPREKDLGGFSVRRILPYAKRRMVGPWIFFDHMGPANLPPGEGINVAPHPHINLATVTYLFEGEILHRDSLGSHQSIHPGDINLMVAGRGITHSERESNQAKTARRNLHGLQLWHALPEKDEEIDPAFYHYPSGELPTFTQNEVPFKLMMGSAFGRTSPVKTFWETFYGEAQLKKGQTFTPPDIEDLAVYVVSGGAEIDGQNLPSYSMAVLSPHSQANVSANEDSRLVFIGGKPMTTRYMYWNFVSSRKDRLEQAKLDWQEDRFPKVPGDEEAFIPLP